jgi:hypothetical protein
VNISTSRQEIPVPDPQKSEAASGQARTNCPYRILNAKITINARLE